MKAILLLPILVENLFRAYILPRFIFIAGYAPQSELVREADQQARNAARLADYYTKKALWGVK